MVPRQVYARIRPLGQEEEEPIVQAAGEKRLRLQRSGSGSSGFDSPALESAAGAGRREACSVDSAPRAAALPIPLKELRAGVFSI